MGRLLNDTGVSNRDEITSDSSLIFIGFAEPKTQVEVFIDGESIGSTRANSKGVWFFDNREADLPDGFYEVTATATDRAGNVSKVSETLGVTVDTEAPESPSLELVREDDFIFDDRLEDGPEGRDRDFPQNFFLFEDGPGPEDGVEYTSDNTLSFRGFGEAGTFVAIYLSQEQEGPRERPDFDLARIPDQEPREERLGVVRVKKNGTWNFSLDEPLEDGPYSISVEGIDLAGNVSERSSFLNVTVDTVPPEAPTIERIKKDTGRDNDDGITSDDTLLVIGRAEPRSLVEVLLDEGEEGARVIGFVQANEEGVWRFDYSENPLGDGDYHILASARDFAGNISDLSEPLEITVDTRAPETPTFQRIKKDTGRDNQDEITSDNTLLMIGEAEPESYVQIFLSDGEGVGKKIGTVEANDEGKWRFDHRDNPLEDGTYQISVRAVDIAGNKSLFSEPSQIVIDTVAPEVPSLELVREDNPIFDGPFEGKEQDFAQKPILNQEDRDFENRIEYTSDNTISLRGFAEPGSLVKLFLGKEKIAEIEVGDNGAWAYSLEEPLIDGPYDFSVKAIDIAGNASKASLPLNVIVDTVAPDAPVINGVNSDTGSSGSDGVTSDNTPTIYGTAEPGSLVEVFVGEGRLAGRAFADNSGNWALEYEGEVPARDGYYGVRAHAVDPAGNVSNLSDPFNVVIDTAAPDAPVIENITVDTGVSRGDGITSDNTLSINGRAEANSRVELFINNISVGTTMADGDGNWLFDYTGTTLADGEYSLLARATDQAGNESPDSAVKPLVIDTMGPGAPVIEAISQDTGIPDDAITSDNTIMISGTAEANSTVAVFVNGAPVGQTNTNNDGNWQFDYTKVTLADNAYNVTAQAIDRAGNFGPISNLFTVTIDTNPPAVPVINSFSEDSGQEGDGITADNGLIFDGVADPGSTIILFLNGEEIGRTKVDAERSWRFDYSEVGLQDGPYGLTALAEDIAGNQSEASEPINFVVDTVAPEAPVISGISIDSGSSASDGVTSDNTPAVNGQAEPGSKVEVFLNDESLGITQADLEGSWSLDYVGPPLEDGGYNLTAVATDAAGNASDTSRIFPLRIDTVSPQIPTVYVQQDDMIPDDRNNEEPLLNLFRVEEPNGDDRIPFLSDKTPTFAGMAEPGSTVVILVDGEEAGRAQSNQEGNWTFTFGEPLDELQIELNEGPFGFGEDLQIGLNEGPHDVKVFSIDLAGNQSPESASVGFVVDTIAPEAPLINGISMDTGSSDSDGITSDSTPTIRGMAEAGSRVEVFINGNSIGFTGADPEGSWSLSYQGPPLEDGLHNVAAVARDRAGNTSDTSEDYPIQIDLAPPPAPNINSISADTGLDGKDGITSDNTLVIKGDAEIGATVEVFIDGQSIGTKKVGENGKWSLNYKKTTLEDGDYVLTASAVSLAGLEGPLSDEFLIKIDTVAPKAPGISGVNSDSGASASDGITSDNRPDLEGTAEPGSRVQIFQDGKSIGKVFADEDGNWQFGMRRLSDGNYTLTAEQKDLAGNKSLASDPFDLVIDTVAPKAPVITHISDDTGTMSVDHIVNGDFEGGNAGWTFDANGTEISFSASVYGLSNQGHGSVVSEMIAELPVTLSQNLTNLIFGESYTLSFDIALRNNPEVGDGLRVVWNGVTVFDETGESALIQDWQTFNLNLVAGSGDGSDTIEFIGLSGDSGDSRGAVLDNVSFVGLALDTIDGVTSDNTLFINGTAEANSEVEVFFDGISVGMTQADERGNWRFDNSENLLENGSYEVTAQAKDAADNASPVSEIYNVTVTTPPQEELLLQTGFGENNTFEWDSAALLDLNSLANGEHGHYRTLDLSVNEGSVSLNLNEVLDVSGPNNYLVIEGDADNAVEIEDEQGWSLVQTGFNEGGNVYNVYTNGDATLQIDQSIVIQSIVPV